MLRRVRLEPTALSLLTQPDVDSPATFDAQAGTTGTYGTFTINAAGAWTYTTDSAHNEFVAGTTYTDTFNVTSSDGTTSSVVVNILGTNDAPQLGGATQTLNYTQYQAPILIDSALTVTDIDLPANFNGGFLLVNMAANGTANDQLYLIPTGSGTNQISLSGNHVKYGNNIIGTLDTLQNGRNGQPLKISLNNNASIEAVQALARCICFSNHAAQPSTLDRTVNFTLNDGSGTPLTSMKTAVIKMALAPIAPSILSIPENDNGGMTPKEAANRSIVNAGLTGTPLPLSGSDMTRSIPHSAISDINYDDSFNKSAYSLARESSGYVSRAAQGYQENSVNAMLNSQINPPSWAWEHTRNFTQLPPIVRALASISYNMETSSANTRASSWSMLTPASEAMQSISLPSTASFAPDSIQTLQNNHYDIEKSTIKSVAPLPSLTDRLGDATKQALNSKPINQGDLEVHRNTFDRRLSFEQRVNGLLKDFGILDK
ncbi:MAG: hypothetical protein A3E85_02885 [Gammaproteobacteria bacterium RIFCSPHIGHO2_12_FULL_45_12]|nr:MAG: hypothetical protein A3E85_02885 [Gammaproteobacteria bacterium RIFCSPHIGHO2_12_FULL_45_12]